jgi:hypothetical protein
VTDFRDDLAASHERIVTPEAERDTDPHVKTLAELDAEESVRDKIEDADSRAPWVGWALFVGGVLFIAGGIVRACWGPS